MSSRKWIAAAIAALFGVVSAPALAQIPPPDVPETTPTEVPDEEEPDTGEATTEPAPTPIPQPVAPPVEEDVGDRPQPLSLGIGFGWLFDPDQDLTVPNTVSARLVMTPRMVLEPRVTLAYSSFDEELTDPERETGNFDLELGTALRYSLMSKGKLDLLGLGVIALGFDSTNVNPEDANNSITTNEMAFVLGWGVGLEYFFKPHWSLSFDATNPFFLYEKTTVEVMEVDESNTTLAIGAVFDPTVRMMIHLYF